MTTMPSTWADAVGRWRSLQRDGIEAATEPGRRVIVVASFTANPIEPALGVALAEHEPQRAPATIDFADYNQLFQVCADPAGHGVQPDDDVVLLWRIEDVFERDLLAWAEGSDAAAGRLHEGVGMLADSIRRFAAGHGGGVVVADAAGADPASLRCIGPSDAMGTRERRKLVPRSLHRDMAAGPRRGDLAGAAGAGPEPP